MVGYLVAEWREWEARRFKPSIALFAIAGIVALAYAYLQPFLAGTATTAASLLAGWISANRYKPGYGQRRILAEAGFGASGLGPAALVAGRCLVSLASFALCLLVLSPALAIVADAWGIGPGGMAAALCLWFGAFLLAMSGAFLSGLVLGHTEHLVGAYALAAWFLPVSLWKPARAFNPFIQAWAALGRGKASAGFLCAGGEFLAAALLLAAAGLALRSLAKANRA